MGSGGPTTTSGAPGRLSSSTPHGAGTNEHHPAVVWKGKKRRFWGGERKGKMVEKLEDGGDGTSCSI